jgi:hypothetical protein
MENILERLVELRPAVWTDYLNELKKIREEFKDNTNYKNAIEGNTNIECFNEWVNELKKTIIYIIMQECGLQVFGFLL